MVKVIFALEIQHSQIIYRYIIVTVLGLTAYTQYQPNICIHVLRVKEKRKRKTKPKYQKNICLPQISLTSIRVCCARSDAWNDRISEIDC